MRATAYPDVFNLGAGFTNLETVTVGDPGNLADSRYGSYGSVGYTYNIGKYEVTAKQYTEFLNAKAKTDDYGLYNSSMWSDSYGCKIQQNGVNGNYTYSVASDRVNRPVNYVNYWDACRFTNWLGNGQGNGDMETGAYTLTLYGIASNAIPRNSGATWALTSKDEWYKAAYYKSGSINAGYWNYPTQSDTPPNTWLGNPVDQGITRPTTTISITNTTMVILSVVRISGRRLAFTKTPTVLMAHSTKVVMSGSGTRP